jgi:hypothetical protein
MEERRHLVSKMYVREIERDLCSLKGVASRVKHR